MKKIFVLIIAIFATASTYAQDYKFSALDKSPADMVYYPLRAPFDKDQSSAPVIKVIYSRPQKNGREIFGVLEKFGAVWRTGANESTEIQFFKAVKFGNKTIPAGTYSLFTIPQKDNWTIIINKNINKWGAYTYDESKDIARLNVPVIAAKQLIEAFSITFLPAMSGAKMIMGWDNTVVEVPFSF